MTDETDQGDARPWWRTQVQPAGEATPVRSGEGDARSERGTRGTRGGRKGHGGRGRPTVEEPRSALPGSALAGAPRRGRGARFVNAEDEQEQAPPVPARIKAIEEHGRKAGRYTVRLEPLVDGDRGGMRSATVSAEIVERLGLRVGLALQAAQVGTLREEAAALRTYDRALNLLAFRARSSTDLRRKLVEKGEPGPLADRAIARLTALGLLNDEDFARQVARGKLLGGTSKRRVQQELWRKGVSREVADEAVADVVADEQVDEGEGAVKVARRKAASLAKLDPPTRRRRLYAFLARRGYDHDAIRAAMKAVLEPGDDEVDGGEGEGADE